MCCFMLLRKQNKHRLKFRFKTYQFSDTSPDRLALDLAGILQYQIRELTSSVDQTG